MMYYLVAERPLQSALGTLIMISGLMVYAAFRNRNASRAALAPSDCSRDA
jgi:APA family basic amino acid/polyamine antiporter